MLQLFLVIIGSILGVSMERIVTMFKADRGHLRGMLGAPKYVLRENKFGYRQLYESNV
jgi:hypothetical protein